MTDTSESTPDFFCCCLDQMIDDLRHSLAQRLPWAQIEAALAPHFARKTHAGTMVDEGVPVWPDPGACWLGRERSWSTLLAGAPDGGVVAISSMHLTSVMKSWSTLGRFRVATGKARGEELLKATMDAAVTSKAIELKEF